jgi:DNA-binding MarR family transcriptional regulator
MADQARRAVETAVAGLFHDPALESVLAETAALFHRLRYDAERIHGQGERSSGRRAILRSLSRLGPQTVPDMARARPVSRQAIQRVVNELTEDGFVEAVENPAHKRSSLIQLTPAGETKLEAMAAKEREVFDGLKFDVAKGELRQAAETLRRVRKMIESPEWQRRIAAAEESQP